MRVFDNQSIASKAGSRVRTDDLLITNRYQHRPRVDERAATPFAFVTFYKPLSHDELKHELTYEAFLEWVNELLPSQNISYAIRN
jgi:alpha-acetolactate decarboxylase